MRGRRFCKNKQTSFIIRRRVGRPQQRVVSFQACSICLPASLAGLQQATLARPATLHRRPPRARAASMPSCPIRRRGRRMRGTARAPILYKQGARAGRTLHARPGILHLAHPALTKFVGEGKDCCIMLLLRCWGAQGIFRVGCSKTAEIIPSIPANHTNSAVHKKNASGR